MRLLENKEFIEIIENDETYKGQEYFKFRIKPDIDTKNGKKHPYCQIPLNLLRTLKNLPLG